MDLANVAVAIEPTPFKQGQERANIAATIVHDLDLGGGIAAPNRFDQSFATRNCRDDQIEGNREAPKRPGDVGPSVLIVDVSNDRHRRARGPIRDLSRTRPGRPPVEKFRMLGGKVAIDCDADVYPVLIVSGKALAFSFRTHREERELIVFQVLLFPEEKRQTQPRP